MVSRFVAFLVCFVCCSAFIGKGQRAYRIQPVASSPVIDGRLNDACWQQVESSINFTQVVPEPDQPSRYRSEVRMAYDREGIYVMAILSEPPSLQIKQITARDVLGRCNADVFGVFLDPYRDKQNGFVFKVSSAGVQQDERLSGGAENGDIGWDAVWESAVSSNDTAWIVEMAIPFSALRFSADSIQSWGLNFLRVLRSKNENSYWNPVNVQQQGFLAQAGTLVGLRHLEPPVRLFLYPYLSTGLWRKEQEGKSAAYRWLRSGGLDVKYGINESFTLDLTLIPDFSQVVSDNLVRNLSPFEQQLTENRPFFTEGTELFNKSGTFYSRRIGGRPSGYYSVESDYNDTAVFRIERNPNITSLLNAFKVSGRTRSNLGIGVFNALASSMFAEVRNKQTGKLERIQTEPLTNYNLFVVDRPLKGQSYINITNTNRFIPSSMYVGNVAALKWVQFDNKQQYRMNVGIRNSLRGDRQMEAGHYADWSIGKVSGLFRYVYAGNFISPNYSQQDMGILFDYNHSWHNVGVSYNQNKPKSPKLQTFRLSWDNSVAFNTAPSVLKYYSTSFNYFILFKNWWDITFELESRPLGTVDFYQLGAWNKRLQMFPYTFVGVNGSSDSRKKLFWGYYIGYGSSFEKGVDYTYVEQTVRRQLGDRWEVSVRGEFTNDRSNLGLAYVDAQNNTPIIAHRHVRQINGELNVKLNISPDLNITGRIRHYNAQINHISFHQTDALGAWKPYLMGYRNNLNENYNLQNIDIFLNWIFKPGSRLVLSYKQWLNDAYILNNNLGSAYFQNVAQVIQKPKAMEFNVRWIYFVDYDKTRKNFRPLLN